MPELSENTKLLNMATTVISNIVPKHPIADLTISDGYELHRQTGFTVSDLRLAPVAKELQQVAHDAFPDSDEALLRAPLSDLSYCLYVTPEGTGIMKSLITYLKKQDQENISIARAIEYKLRELMYDRFLVYGLGALESEENLAMKAIAWIWSSKEKSYEEYRKEIKSWEAEKFFSNLIDEYVANVYNRHKKYTDVTTQNRLPFFHFENLETRISIAEEKYCWNQVSNWAGEKLPENAENVTIGDINEWYRMLKNIGEESDSVCQYGKLLYLYFGH